jgi:hypothetical protein
MPAPLARGAYGDSGGLQIANRGLPAHASRLLNASRWPAEPAQGEYLDSFLFAQDIAHIDGGYPPRPFQCPARVLRWPVFK